MFCQRCQKQEATVHLTVVVDSSAQVSTQNYCESCYAAIEAARLKAYGELTEPPKALEPIREGEFRCFGCGAVIHLEDERCRACGWSWK